MENGIHSGSSVLNVHKARIQRNAKEFARQSFPALPARLDRTISNPPPMVPNPECARFPGRYTGPESPTPAPAGAQVQHLSGSPVFLGHALPQSRYLICAAVALLYGGVTPLLQFKGLLFEMMPWRKSRRNVSAVAAAVAEAKAATT